MNTLGAGLLDLFILLFFGKGKWPVVPGDA
jgi:hypothetical protein